MKIESTSCPRSFGPCKDANQKGLAPPLGLPIWMNSDVIRPIGVMPDPAGYLAFSYFKDVL